MNTVPPNDWTFFEMLNEVVQKEPATSLDAELMGPIAAVGIVKGKPFAPDARMKKIMTEALAVANATSRSLFMNPRDPSWFYYPGFVVVQLPVRFNRLRVRDADPGDHEGRRQAVSRPPATAPWMARTQFLLRRHRHHARDGDAPDRHRLAVSAGDGGCRQELLRRRPRPTR